MTRLLVVEPSYCPYQAGFSSAATAVSEVIEGESQILKPFGTPRIGLICSKSQSQLKYNRQVNDEGITVRGRFLICGLNGDKVVGLSKDQADRYSRLLFLPQVEDMPIFCGTKSAMRLTVTLSISTTFKITTSLLRRALKTVLSRILSIPPKQSLKSIIRLQEKSKNHL